MRLCAAGGCSTSTCQQPDGICPPGKATSGTSAGPSKLALGSTQVRKVRGPLLDTLYARLMRCGSLAYTGKPFTEHRNIPDLRPDPADPRGSRPLTNCGQRSGLRRSLPVTLSHRFPNCTSPKGSNPAPCGTRSWRWPKKGLCTSATGGRRRSQASRSRAADCRPHGRGTEAALRARPSSTRLQCRR